MNAQLVNNNTINDFVSKYLSGKKHLLPPELQSLEIGQWNVSHVTNMNWLFAKQKKFNEPLNDWDVSNVNSMYGMFDNAHEFNQPLNWNVSKVTTMGFMFNYAKKFNQPLNWDVSNVNDMECMFQGAEEFNQPLNDWNVSKVTKMAFMFNDAKKFNQPLNNWVVSKVKTMECMFQDAKEFNQPLNLWDVSNVSNMKYMFRDAITFNQPINNWKIKYAFVKGMFDGATSFNPDFKPGVKPVIETVFSPGPELPSALKMITFYNTITLEDETLENFFTENATDGPFVIKFNHNYYATSVKDLLRQQTNRNDPVEFVECKEDTPASWQGNAYAQWKKEGSLVFVKLEVAGAKVLVEKPTWLWSGENRPSAVFNLVPRGKVHKFMSTHLLPMRENFNALGSEHCNQTIEQMSYRLEPLTEIQLGGGRKKYISRNKTYRRRRNSKKRNSKKRNSKKRNSKKRNSK